MMKKNRRHFSREFKLSVIAELESGKSITQVAREHGIHPSMPFRWKVEFNEYPDAAFRGNGKKQKEERDALGQWKASSQIHNRNGKRNIRDIFNAIQHDLSIDPNLSICRACQLHGLSRSTYYKLKDRPQPAHHETEADIDQKNQIREITQRCPDYGYRRVTKELKNRDYSVNHKRVLRIMQEERREVSSQISDNAQTTPP
jgi:transposase